MKVRTKRTWGFAVIGAFTLVVACGGGGSSSTSPTPTPTPGPGTTTTPTITISDNAVSPNKITVTRGSQVTFVNNDSRSHEMTSDSHPAHTDCPEINQVGLLTPGQSRQTGNFNTAKTCAFHDHAQDWNGNLLGTITIQ